ncbi:MAG: type II toxin-antitoxin system HicA family toxin [Spirochaetales bacterium]|nr:type II toxin-antitoxin system HicA family toxin [Spirochaetales bacterium]
MGKTDKIFNKIVFGKSDNNISFVDLCSLLEKIEFKKRIKGDNYIFYHIDIAEILSLRPKGTNAKAYQVKQVREVILKYKLEV